MFGDSPRELYALLEEKCTPIGARLIFWSVSGGAAAGGILILLTLAAKINRNIVSPLIDWLRRTSVPTISAASVVSVGISIVVTIVLVALAVYLTIRWMRGWLKAFIKLLSNTLQQLSERVGYLEANSADVRSTNESVTALMRRVTGLEPPPRARLREPGNDAAIEGLRQAMLVRALREHAGIRSVIPEEEDEEQNPEEGH